MFSTKEVKANIERERRRRNSWKMFSRRYQTRFFILRNKKLFSEFQKLKKASYFIVLHVEEFRLNLFAFSSKVSGAVHSVCDLSSLSFWFHTKCLFSNVAKVPRNQRFVDFSRYLTGQILRMRPPARNPKLETIADEDKRERESLKESSSRFFNGRAELED